MLKHPVIRLRRVLLANLDLSGLRPGESREIKGQELRVLQSIATTAHNRRRHGTADQVDGRRRKSKKR